MDMLQYIAKPGMVLGAIILLQQIKRFVDRDRMKKALPKLPKLVWWTSAVVLGIGCAMIDQAVIGFTTIGAAIDACVRYAGGAAIVYNGYKAGRG